MSLLGRSGLDATSWARSLRASFRIVTACVVGIFLAWLILRIITPSADSNMVTALYDSTSSDTALSIIYGIATLGDLIWVPLIFWLYVFRKDNNEWASSLIVAVAMMTAMGLTEILKVGFNLPRPFSVIPGITPRHEVPTNPGFPSGHTTNAFTVATVIWTRYPAWRVPFVALGIATGISMVILGLHFPSDIIGGFFLGIFCGTFALSLAKLRAGK